MMQFFERLWPALVMLVVIFGIHLARYWQKKWTREITDTSFQVSWILQIYMYGFFIAGLAYWIALSPTTIGSDYPKTVEELNNSAQMLRQFKDQHEALQCTSRILTWFIFFCVIWVSKLLTELSSQLLTKPTDPNASLPKDWR